MEKNEQNSKTKKEILPKYDKMKKSKKMAETESSNKLKIYKEAGPQIDCLEKNERKIITSKKYIPKADSTKDVKYLKKKRRNIEEINEEETQQNKKKIKSDGDMKSKKEAKFFLKKIDDFEKAFVKWKKIKSIQIDKDGVVTEKLKDDDLILNKCQEIAIDKLNQLKNKIEPNLDDIYHILSYDNINPSLLYHCFLLLKDKEKLNELLSEYKFCFSDTSIIIDYFNNNNKINIDLHQTFNYRFIFKNIKEGIIALKNTIVVLLELIEKNSTNNIKNKKEKGDKIEFVYHYDVNNNIIENENKNDLFDLGKRWLKYYFSLKDFEKFKANQPFSFENNNILYITFCIYEIYKPLVDIDDNKQEISINKNYFPMIEKLNLLLVDLVANLDKENIDKEFQYKIRFFSIIFDTKKPKCSNIETKFMNHILQKENQITEKDIEDFITEKKTRDKKSRILREYTLSEDVLKIEEKGEIIEFNIKEYDINLIKDLSEAIVILKQTWERNNLKSFQDHNLLLKEDITFLKETISKIFKSNFWDEIYAKYCDNDFTRTNPFKNDEFIDQFFKRIIFLPFDINDIGIFAYTTADDLFVFISGYPYMNEEFDIDNYAAIRILQLGVSIIVILHEAIHYYKRLLYFLSCNMVSTTTIINNERGEGGNLLEEILFGGKRKVPKKLYIKTAFTLLNAKLYEQNIETVQKILLLSKKKTKKDKNEEECKIQEDLLLSEFKKKLDLFEPKKYEDFLKSNKNKYASASKDCFNEELVVKYFLQDHRPQKKIK